MDDHRRTPWHCQPVQEVYEALRTSGEGLSDAEAAERLKKDGHNELRSKPPKSILQMLYSQLIDPMVLILVGAAVCSAVLREWTEAGVIFAIVALNAVIGIVQEKKAQSSLEALRNMSAPTARVLRQGDESIIPASEVVAGDIVFLLSLIHISEPTRQAEISYAVFCLKKKKKKTISKQRQKKKKTNM